MNSFKFNDQELNLLRNLYQNELEAAEDYVKKIKSLLNKLSVPGQMVHPEPKVKLQKKRGRKPKVAKEEPVPVVVKKERKKRTATPKSAKQTEPKFENIVVPVPVNKERKQKLAITREPEMPKPSRAIDQETISPVKSTLAITPPPQPVFSTSSGKIPIVKEVPKTDTAPAPPPIIQKPILSSFFPNNQTVKKKKFRPKRPRIVLQNLSRPITK